jgi:hypothetical protein
MAYHNSLEIKYPRNWPTGVRATLTIYTGGRDDMMIQRMKELEGGEEGLESGSINMLFFIQPIVAPEFSELHAKGLSRIFSLLSPLPESRAELFWTTSTVVHRKQ